MAKLLLAIILFGSKPKPLDYEITYNITYVFDCDKARDEFCYTIAYVNVPMGE